MDQPPPATQEVIAFVQQHALVALSTVSPEGQPRAANIYVAIDDNLDFYFMTKVKTLKYTHIQHNPRVALVTADESNLQTVQLEGIAEEVHVTQKQHWIIEQLSRNAVAHDKEGLPIRKMAGTNYAFIKIRPTWLRWGKFKAPKGQHIFEQIIPHAT